MIKFFRAKYPGILKIIYPKRISSFQDPKSIYLTFDDGPIPEVTPWVLEQLQQFHAKATFFCIGKNVKKHPGVFQKLLRDGHAIGNHTYDHLNGWKTSSSTYIENTKKAEEILSMQIQDSNYKGRNSTKSHSQLNPDSKLFRPPFGKITNRQAQILSKKGYYIVMWDVISGDYDPRISAKKSLKNIIDNSKGGSVLVFHDSQKAFPTLKKILPEILEFYTAKGFAFKKLTDAPLKGL